MRPAWRTEREGARVHPIARAPGDPASAVRMTIAVPRIERALWVAGSLLCLAGVAAELAVHVLGTGDLGGLVPLFDLSYEVNLPTWYSATLMLACAVALAVAAAAHAATPDAGRWRLLAGIFLYMAADEASSIHEQLNRLFDLHGILYFSWVIPAGLAVGALGLVFLPFLGRLPEATRWRFVRAGAIYVGGALGVELVLGWWTDRHGDDNLVYGLIDAVEESLEILGLSLFLSAVVRHLAAGGREVGSPGTELEFAL